MSLRTVLFKRTEVVLVSAVTTIAFPALATDGQSISVAPTNRGQGTNYTGEVGVWQATGFGAAHVDTAIFVEGSAAITFSGGLGVYGFRADKTMWYLLGALNGGVAIPILGATTGWSAIVESVGVYDRLAIGPLTATSVTVTGGNATVRACQIAQAEDIWGA